MSIPASMFWCKPVLAIRGGSRTVVLAWNGGSDSRLMCRVVVPPLWGGGNLGLADGGCLKMLAFPGPQMRGTGGTQGLWRLMLRELQVPRLAATRLARDDNSKVGLLLSQVSEARPGAPIFLEIDAVRDADPSTRRLRDSLGMTVLELRAGAAAFGYLVDDALDEDYLDVDVAGEVGDELGDEVVGGG
jgi:hypothetical protein